MTREERAVILVFLISFLYGLGIFIQSGVFVIPTPLFPVFTFVLSVYFAGLHFRKEKLLSFILVAATFMELSASPIFLSFFLNEEYIAQLERIDLLKFLSLVFLIVGLSISLYSPDSVKNTLICFLSCGTLLLSGFLNSYLWYLLSLSFISIMLYFQPKRQYPIHLITLTFLIFRSTEWFFLKFVS